MKSQKLTLVSSIILLLFLLLTDPQELSPWLLALPFGLLFLILLSACLGALQRYGMERPKRLRISVSVASVVVILLALQSLGQLTVRDVLVLCLFFGISYIYVARLGVRQVG